jgi:HTH-type transcriptional regulator/antitoxin HigA
MAAEAYEDSIPLMPIPVPQSLEEMIKLKMYQLKVNQKELAQLLGVTETRLSEVLRGKRNLNMDFARRLHEKLGIDGNFILEKA